MSKRQLIFYNDARHSHMYCYEPPMSLENVWAPIDEVSGTGVDTFVYGMGNGSVMLHQTQVGEVWGSRISEAQRPFAETVDGSLRAISSWRAYENLKSLTDIGLDPIKLLIDRAHSKGLEFFTSCRQTNKTDPKLADHAQISRFKLNHPEWNLQGKGKYNFNWIHPEIRAERLAIIEETIDRYDIDGFEVDWSYCPFFFEESEIEQNYHILTEHMRDVRSVIQHASDTRGKTIWLGARVLPTLSGNVTAGLDVATWIKEDLLDFVVPNFYGDRQIDGDFPFEWLIELTRSTDCKVYPALQGGVRALDIGDSRQEPTGVGENHATVDQYRAAAAAYWSKGADAIYLQWFQWPIDTEQKQILSEIHDPDLIREKPKHYVVRRDYEKSFVSNHGYEPEEISGYTSQLKATLETGMEPPGHIVYCYVADESINASTRLKIRLIGSTILDLMTVSLNKIILPWETCTRTDHDGYYGTWLEFPLEQGVLCKGRNEVAVTLRTRPDNLALPVLLESVDIIVEYSSPKSN